ncbi:MAG: heme biosynthesis protein HemY, partial [Gammaproteobacteria bacterium]|nr:heme biosynthesis protein HemY [Gammaproteobacteria bacterium]
ALRMLGELCYQQQDWAQLTGLFPALRKAKNTSNVLLDKWTIECFEAQLLTPNIDLQSIEAYWQQLPRALRKNNRLISARVNALINCNEPDLAGSELQKVIKSSNDPELIGLYGELKMSDADAQLRHTEKWLTQHPEDPVVLLAAGRACIRNKLWGKARSYIETSIGIAPTPAAFHELGQLMLQLDDPAAATNAFAKGLTLSNTGSLNLPQLEKTTPQ